MDMGCSRRPKWVGCLWVKATYELGRACMMYRQQVTHAAAGASLIDEASHTWRFGFFFKKVCRAVGLMCGIQNTTKRSGDRIRSGSEVSWRHEQEQIKEQDKIMVHAL
jgi:hypothetical protein